MANAEKNYAREISKTHDYETFPIYGMEHLISELNTHKKDSQPLVIIMTGVAGSGKTTGAMLISKILSNEKIPINISLTTKDLPKTPFLTPENIAHNGVLSTDFFFADRKSPLRESPILEDWWRKNDFQTTIHNVCNAIRDNKSFTPLHSLYNRPSGQIEYTDKPLPFPIKNYVIIEGMFAHRAIPILNEYGISIIHIRFFEKNSTILDRFVRRVQENPYRSLEAQYKHYEEQIKPQWETIQKELLQYPHNLRWTSIDKGFGVLIQK